MKTKRLKPNILVIDDDPVFGNAFCTHSRFHGAEAEYFPSLYEALYTVPILDYDLIVSDCLMPQINGSDVAHYATTLLDQTPVLLVSASDAHEAARNWQELGACGFIKKDSGVEPIVEQAIAYLSKDFEEEPEKISLYQSLVRTSPDIVYILDTQSKKVTFRNRSLWIDLGYDLQEVEAPDAIIPQQYLHPLDRIEPSDLFRSLNSLKGSEVYQTILRLRAKDGTWRSIQIRLSAMTRAEDGSPLSCMGVLTDITEACEGKKIIREARACAERALRAKTLVLTQMSHEIRTPLGCIVGAASLLQDKELPKSQLRLVNQILQSGTALVDLLDQVLEHGKLSKGHVSANNEVIDLFSLCKTTIESFETQAKVRGLQFELSIGPDIPVNVYADPLIIRRILNNLVSNAIKYTESGWIKTQVKGSVRGDRFVLQVLVADSGIGITQELQERIFDSYTRGESKVHTAAGGSGLGLAIVKDMVDLLEGKIWFESQSGKGTVFSLEIPLKLVPQSQPAEVVGAKDWEGQIPKSNILLVDDNPDGRFLYQMMINRLGMNCKTAKSGAQAINRCRNSIPDLIFMDCQMPDFDGFETTRRIRGLEGMEHVPIVALTAHPKVQVASQAQAVGMIEVMSKPIQMNDLEEILQRRLGIVSEKIAANPGKETA